MQTKLTLRLDDTLIEQAKTYAKQHNKSLSKVVADYFKVMAKQTKNDQFPPITQSLVGIIEPSDISDDDYKKHLEGKYL
ncbi:MAG: antitoxin [Gammaproteobacteria bacterium]|nr:antitoxin [Gammaproteobacteria bacterium]